MDKYTKWRPLSLRASFIHVVLEFKIYKILQKANLLAFLDVINAAIYLSEARYAPQLVVLQGLKRQFFFILHSSIINTNEILLDISWSHLNIGLCNLLHHMSSKQQWMAFAGTG